MPSAQTPINISGDIVAQSSASYPADQRILIQWLFGYAKSNAWSMNELEHQSKISKTTLYRVFVGKYRNDAGEQVALDGLCEKIVRFKALAEARDMLGRLPFTHTSVFKRIEKMCREIREEHSIGLIFGESQIGKTASLQEVSRVENHGLTPYVLVPAAAGVQGLMKAIADACHISRNSCFDQLRTRVVNYLDESKLLILDEVHEIFTSYQRPSVVKCFGLLRQIHDITGCGMILCGTNVMRNEFERGEFAQSLKQLLKRGIWTLQLDDTPPAADIDLIAAHYRLGKPNAEVEKLVATINKEHGLGKFTKFLARASALAKARNQKFAWSHFMSIVTIAENMRMTTEQKAKARANAQRDLNQLPFNPQS